MELPVRKCGSQGFECPVQGLGCMGMSSLYGTYATDEAQAESLRVLEKVMEYGKVMLDSSDVYGPYTNEELIGKAIAGRRDKYIIATKCGIQSGEFGGKPNSSPEYIKKCCEASLKRLGIDCIDLYYLHRYDRTTPIEDTMNAFKELVEEGKIRYVGVSEMSPDVLRIAHAVCPITACQLEWSLFTRNVEDDVVPTCRELGIGIVAYSPLGRGLLTGAYTSMNDFPEGDRRYHLPRFSEHLEENLKLVEVVKEIAAEKGCTVGQFAMAWVHAQGEDVFPIPGTKKVERLVENIGAFNISVTESDKARVAGISSKVKGTRYNPAQMKYTYRGECE